MEDAPHIHVTIVLKGSLLNEHSELDIMDKSDRGMSKTPAVTTLESVLKRLSTVPILGVDPFKFGDKATKTFLLLMSY